MTDESAATGAEMVPLHSRDLEVRSEALRRFQAAVLALEDEVEALTAAGDYETLATGGQDLQVIAADMRDLMERVRRNIARIVDEKQGQLSSDGTYYYGINRVEVPGVGVVEVNGGWTRKNWASADLLRHLLATVLADTGEMIVTAEGEVVDPAESATVAAIITVIRDTMPLTSSLSWKVGTDETKGLKKYGVDDRDWCERVPKVRLATIPKRDL